MTAMHISVAAATCLALGYISEGLTFLEWRERGGATFRRLRTAHHTCCCEVSTDRQIGLRRHVRASKKWGKRSRSHCTIMSLLGLEVNFVSSDLLGFGENDPNQLPHLARGENVPTDDRSLSSGVLTANTLGGDGGSDYNLKIANWPWQPPPSLCPPEMSVPPIWQRWEGQGSE